MDIFLIFSKEIDLLISCIADIDHYVNVITLFFCVSVQYLFDAGESEAWMSEQELYMISEERARDEVGAGNMLKKHANMEKTVEDYADVVRQLGDRARQLIDQDHPDKSVPNLEIVSVIYIPLVITVILLFIQLHY